MAGTIGGFGLQVQFDTSGNLARGALLYTYAANTSTPADTFSDFSLTSQQQWPLVADGSGRLPMFWVDDGDYRVRLTTSGGIEIFDEQSITAIGSSSGSSSGGTSQDTTTLFQTGYHIWQPISGSLSGFVRANGLTIGSGSSGATERANGDTQSLFEWYWNNFSDALCAVSTGRGASATADFNANKTIATLSMLDCVPIGLSGMGNTSSGLISDTAATAVGATTKTISQANLPSFSLDTSGLSGTITNGPNVVRTTNFSSNIPNTGGSVTSVPSGASAATLSIAAGGITGTLNSGGSGTALSIIPKGRVGSWFVKL